MNEHFLAFDAVLFDLDGTLMDTAPDFYTTLHKLCDRYDISRLNEKTIRDNVSDGSRALTALCFPELDLASELFEARRMELLKLYEGEVGKATKLFPEMEKIITQFDAENMRWGIVTNKPRLYTELLLKRTGLAKTCHTLVCADDLQNAKPDPEGILKACDELQVNPANCLYVGDHKRDVIAGKAARCITAIVSFGYFENAMEYLSWNANIAIHSSNDIEQLPTK